MNDPQQVGVGEINTQNPSRCPIRLDAEFTLLAFNCSHCTLKQIRESLIKCLVCTDYEHCDLHEELHARVNRSLSALNEAWGWE